uniref:DNA damage-binding protein 1 n=1 Tax=Arcella intermedia TaxID=1963864 RepID=A0A6B2KWM0_9EUKA|eukprot:TRINITY_DN11841_c0_g1_i1.p1 TRINITY_DN11841_c0_g1~~TRINITY_DN11841_c0_g1_i1.p1  ORF type:complete len:1108 (-),score=261.45 TRINITY_DN11841_c0_g1_i1:31-3303(-)
MYVVTAHKPTIVTHSLVGHFTAPTDNNLILCKVNRLEVYSISEEGLELVLDVGIFGKISRALLFRNAGDKQDSLFITTEKFTFCVLAYDSEKGEIITKATGDIQESSARDATVGQLAIYDPVHRVIVLHLNQKSLKVIFINENGILDEPINMSIEELIVLDITFLSGYDTPTVAVLYQDTKEERYISAYKISKSQLTATPCSLAFPNVEQSADLLISLPIGGLLVIGEEAVAYYNEGQMISTAMKRTLIKAYGFIDMNNSSGSFRILLGDYAGILQCLVVLHDGKTVKQLQLELIGETSIPSTLSYLENGFTFVGSTSGDSQLIKLEAEKDPETGQLIQIIENFTNLGPIVDFCVVDMDMQGQGQIVTCSGKYKDGSLRVVRNGVGINEIAQIPLPGIKGTWSLSPPKDSKFEKYLAVSFVGETRILAMAGEELEETEIQGFLLDQQTLYCGNVIGNQYIQITMKAVNLIDAVTESKVATWTTPEDSKISVCSANFQQVAIAIKGKELVILEISPKELKQVGKQIMPYDIACINIDPLKNSNDKASLCAVGLWTDISVRILVFPDLLEVRKVEIGGEIIPRSLLFKTFEDITYLFIALGDGHLISYTYDLKSGELENKKKICIGTRPVTLNKFNTTDSSHVFATSDRPVVIHQSASRKLVYANINLKEVNYMCDFDCTSFSSALALATENTLTIGTLEQIQQLHIRTIPLGEVPRRICHNPALESYCLLTLSSEINESGHEVDTSNVKLIDDKTFEVKDNFKLEPREEAWSLCTYKLAGSDLEYFIVGTAFSNPEEQSDPVEGRILLFTVKEEKLRLMLQHKVKGAVYCLKPFKGKILASINSKVQLFKWKEVEGASQLALEAEHSGQVVALYLDTRGDFIVVGDIMRSVKLLIYSSSDSTIKELSKHLDTMWVTGVQILDDDNYLVGHDQGNVFSVAKNSGSVTMEARGLLDDTGKFHVGELINHFEEGSFVMKISGEGPNIPKTMIYGGVNGSLGVIATLEPPTFQYFHKIQQCIAKHTKAIGGFDHAHWRSFVLQKRLIPAFGFIDGDLVESFLELPNEQMDIISKELKIPIEELTKNIEAISKALH